MWEVLSVHVHPTYNTKHPPSERVDLAILRVSPITFGATVKPIILARPQDSILWSPGAIGTVSGFGSPAGHLSDPNYGKLSPTLVAVDVPFVSESECTRNWMAHGLLYEWSIICAGLFSSVPSNQNSEY